MKVQEIVLQDGRSRYILLDDDSIPVIVVLRYLKFLDNTGKSRNTQKTYCYALKSYFEYLSEVFISYQEVNMQHLSSFVGYLRNPYKDNIILLKPNRSAKTINLILTVIMGFYDYLFRTEQIESDLANKLTKTVFTRNGRRYKAFLHHITKEYPQKRNILKLREKKKKLTILTKEEVEQIYHAATNIRDRFLICLLFETGMRIGEALSLFIEDFQCDYQLGNVIHICSRGELENHASIKSGERIISVSQDLMNLFDEYMYEISDFTRTDFVFVKISGKNKGRPMSYSEVADLFKRIRTKTGIYVHPHLFRHTHASLYYSYVKDLKHVQERLGHAQVQTTAEMYVHLSDEQLRQSWEAAQPNFKFEVND